MSAGDYVIEITDMLDNATSIIIQYLVNADLLHRHSSLKRMLSEKIYIDSEGRLYHHRNRRFD